MKFLLSLLLLPCLCLAQITLIRVNTSASFRAVSVVDDNTVWVAGSEATVGRSQDGGQSWTFFTVPGDTNAQFRSLYAFDAQTAVIANAGSPGRVFKTTDGGKTWKLVFEDTRKDVFMDGMDFWNEKEGMIYGDPVDGHMYLLQTNDGGISWQELPLENRPDMMKGEASFAASNTGLRCVGTSDIYIISGGIQSRLFHSKDFGKNWDIKKNLILQGKTTEGAYSLAISSDGQVILVGGDYTDPFRNDQAACVFQGKWLAPESKTGGYRECVEYLNDSTAIAIGPTGLDISNDHGKTWQPLVGDEGFHVIKKSRSGSLCILAGSKGKIAVFNH